MALCAKRLLFLCLPIILCNLTRCVLCQMNTLNEMQLIDDQFNSENVDVNRGEGGNLEYSALPELGRNMDEMNKREDFQLARKKYPIKINKFGTKKLGKKKSLRWIYLVSVGVFLSKIFILPMIIKVVALMSSTSFILSKFSLLATIILGLKLFLTNNNTSKLSDSRVEIIHVPIKKDYSTTWDRDTAETKIHPQYHPLEAFADVKPTQFMNLNVK